MNSVTSYKGKIFVEAGVQKVTKLSVERREITVLKTRLVTFVVFLTLVLSIVYFNELVGFFSSILQNTVEPVQNATQVVSDIHNWTVFNGVLP